MRNLAILAVLALAGFGYLVWLHSGCTEVGVMTWQGKVCSENL